MTDFPFDIVGFDLDGTLLDTATDLGAAVNHALASAGREPIPGGETRALIGGGGRMMLTRALELTGGVPEKGLDALYAEMIAHYTAHIAVHTVPFPGCLEALDGLAVRGVKLAVVTNKMEALAVRLLGRLGMAGRFFTIIGGDTLGAGRAKPAPDPLHEMILRGGGGRAAFVGDTTFDTQAAQAAGMPCIAVDFGFNDALAKHLGATAVISHFDELIPALERV